MKIYFDNTEIDLPVNDYSYRYRAIKGEHSLTLYYSLAEHIEIPLGAYCEFEGLQYTLENPENFKKHNNRNYEYTLILDSSQEKLKKYKFKDTTSRKLKFSLTAKPEGHLKMLVENLNQREEGWEVGECIAAVEKVISYNHVFCSDALTQIADAFETEWEIVGKTINIRKVEYNKENPLPLSYGRGNGFKSGIGRTNHGDSKPVEVLFLQGGNRNINPSQYGSSELLLPKSEILEYEGSAYISDADGFSIRRADKPLKTQAEDSLDCSHIYPSRVGTITGVSVVDFDNHFYDFVDMTIPEELNYEDCLIEGETMTVIPQSGMLTGKEFEVKYIHEERRFEIVPQELDGRNMPDDVFKPVINDTYIVFGINMPDAYVCNNSDKTGASWDMFREAVKYFYENEGQKFTFTGELDGIWAKNDWLNIGGRIKLGGYVLFSDNQFQPEGVLIRIVGIKDFINNPQSPSIELSNEIVGSSISSDLGKIDSNEVVMEDLHNDSISFTKRRFRDAQETMIMLQNALLNFSGAINPITVQTMSLLVGDESLQYRFVNNMTNPVQVPHIISYDNNSKVLHVPNGIIQHMTLGIKSLSSEHKTNEYKFWTMSKYNSSPLTDDPQGYYLYAKVSKSVQTGVFRLSPTAIELEGESGYYHLLVGVLNSEFEGERSFVELYGFTEILPGRITTDRVVSSDGQNFLDFVNNSFRVGNSANYLEWNKNNDGKLRLKGTLVQSGSGDESPIGCFRGAYNPSYTYYKGDEVTYMGSTYRYIHTTPTSGNTPTNTTYWIVVASKGDNGENGSYKSFIFKSSETKPSIPTGTNPMPEGWVDAPEDNSITHSGLWTLEVDGYRQSPTIPNNGITINRIMFRTNKTNARTTIHCKVSSESSYDFGLVGKLDTPVSGSNYFDRLSGEASKYISIDVVAIGDHFIDIGYSKDGSSASGQDCCSYIITAVDGVQEAIWWMSNALISFNVNNEDWEAGTWSTPVKTTGEDGEAGEDGKYIDFMYQVTVTKPTKPTTLKPSGWFDEPPTVPAGNFLWMIQAEKTADSTSLIGAWSDPVKISGEKGEQGVTGDYFEYRYAKNGSTTTSPALTVSDSVPSGWTTIMPAVGSLEYIWMTVAKKKADGTLLQNWSAPVRTKGVDGINGQPGTAGPSVVFRGNYESGKTYYGTPTRVDCVKYNEIYYIARTDVGTFSGVIPTNTSKWNTFGAQFDSVATNLLLAEGANIADWIIQDGKITSQDSTANGKPRAQMNGRNGGIAFASDVDTYNEYGGSKTVFQEIIISSEKGSVEARSDIGVSSIDSEGIFANRAGIQALPGSSGVELKASIVGLGFGNLRKEAYFNRGCICGVYGSAYNEASDPAPAYGGYFLNLMARGLSLSVRQIGDTDDGQAPNETDTYLSCYNQKYITLYFKAPISVGKVYYIRINNSFPVNLNTMAVGGKKILMPNASSVNSTTASVQGELITLIWDGQFWLYSTTVS